MAIFPLDITGQAVSNRITNEVVTIVPAASNMVGPAAYILVQFAPFFADNFTITHNGSPLTRGQHFDFIVQNIHALKYIGKELYAGVHFFNRAITGNVTISYNTLGDTWVQNNYQHVAQFFNTYYEQQMVNWDRVFGVPYQLPPLAHPEPISSLKGMEDIVDALAAIQAAIEDADSGPLTTALNNLSAGITAHISNPNGHGTTKVHVGLPNIIDAAEATTLAHIFEATTRYLTSGSLDKLTNIQASMFQILSTLSTENPLTTNNPIFKSNSFTGVTLPEGMGISVEELVVIQVRLPTTTAQRSNSLSTVPRLQIGYGIIQGSDQGLIVVRKLLNTTMVPWAVFHSTAISTMDARYLRREEFPITLTNTNVFQNGTMIVWRLKNDLFMFECFFNIINGVSGNQAQHIVGTLPEALRPRASLNFVANDTMISSGKVGTVKLYKSGQIRIRFDQAQASGSGIQGNYYASGVYSASRVS